MFIRESYIYDYVFDWTVVKYRNEGKDKDTAEKAAAAFAAANETALRDDAVYFPLLILGEVLSHKETLFVTQVENAHQTLLRPPRFSQAKLTLLN